VVTIALQGVTLKGNLGQSVEKFAV
jgi:hypothetical protein